MIKLIRKIFGLETLKSEIEDLKNTISNLKKEATGAHIKSERALLILKELCIVKDEKGWWDDLDYEKVSHHAIDLANKIQKNRKIEFAKKHPSLLKNIRFDGNCHGCVTPLQEGLKSCLFCKWTHEQFCGNYRVNVGIPDLHRKE